MVLQKEGFKVSNYTMYSDTLDGSVAVYNSMNGKLLEVSSDLKDLFYYCIENPSVKNELHSKLVAHEMIVEEQTDELSKLKEIERKILDREDELFIVLLPTEDCNCRCIYCCQSFEKGHMTTEVENGVIDYVRRNVSKYKRLRVEWFGGEPLVNYNSIERISRELIAICHKENVLYTSVITTNGLLLTLDMYKKLKKLGITGYQITLDGIKETHNLLRIGVDVNDTWQTTVDNLKAIRDNIKTKALSIMIRTNITQDIYKEREGYINVIKKEFGTDPRFRVYFRLAGDWGKMIDPDVKSDFCLGDEYYTSLELLAESGLKSTLHSSFLKPGGHVCHAARSNSFLVSSNGVVRKCTCKLDDDNVGDINRLGEINDLQDEYTSEFWDARKYKVPEKCSVCKRAPLCFGRTCPIKENKECPYDLMSFKRILAILPKISSETITIDSDVTPLYSITRRLSEIYDRFGILESKLPYIKVNESNVQKMDSLEFISMIVDIENEFDIEIPDSFFSEESIFNFNFINEIHELM